MKMLQKISILTIVMLFTFCNNIEIEKEKAAKSLKDFLIWYKANYNEINSIALVPNSRLPNDKQYKVNYENLEKYLSFFESSNLVSDEYILNLREYILKCNDEMLRREQVDGPPYGLDFDLVLSTHEVSYSLERIEELEINFENIEISKNKATVTIELAYEITFKLIKVNDKWLTHL